MTASLFHIRIHNFTGATVACRIMGKTPFILHGPENCGETHGAKWFAALLKNVRRDWPHTPLTGAIDCAHHTGQALSALESGIEHVFVGDVSPPALASLRDIAHQIGCQVWTNMVFDAPARNSTETLVINALAFYDMDDHFLPEHELEKRLRARFEQL
tara:strand:+ start:10399 stop:10872 length:474 start_codon:yes stop_codon:yes gene_type:complete